jgi:hypothetical protein
MRQLMAQLIVLVDIMCRCLTEGSLWPHSVHFSVSNLANTVCQIPFGDLPSEYVPLVKLEAAYLCS